MNEDIHLGLIVDKAIQKISFQASHFVMFCRSDEGHQNNKE